MSKGKYSEVEMIGALKQTKYQGAQFGNERLRVMKVSMSSSVNV
jgi:hypothetical protein